MAAMDFFAVPVLVIDFTDRELADMQAEITKNLPQILNSSVSAPWGDNIVTTFKPGRNQDIMSFLLENVAKGIVKATVEYLGDIGYQGLDLRLKDSWFNWHKKGGFMFDHIHPEARVCGVYYYQTNEQDGALRFNNPNHASALGMFPYDGQTMPAQYIPPKVGRMVLWPAWLSHRVEPNCTENERISLNFTLI
jgi:uncharacterized protein (TIGR02466 family)